MKKVSIFLRRTIVIAAAALLFGQSARAGEPVEKTVDGITEPLLDVTLSSSVAGIINTAFFKEGDSVKQGEVILELDKQLEELDEGRRKLVMERNKSDMESTRVLFKTGKSVSKDEMEKKDTEYQVSEVEHAMASQQLAKRSIVSPISGYIAEMILQVGNSCQPYEKLVRVVNTRQCKFVTHIEANAASTLSLGQQVKLEVGGGAKPVPVTATIVFISPVVDPGSGLLKIKALFENPKGTIRPGVTGKMHLN